MSHLIKIADTVSQAINAKTGWHVWTNDHTGYHVSHPDNAATFVKNLSVYKTIDGGRSWDAGVQVPIVAGTSPTSQISAIWFDRWTPGDTGTKIHFCILVLEGVVLSANYVSFDTATDTFSSPVDVGAGSPVVGNLTTMDVSITKSRGGNLVVMGWQDNGVGENFTRRSTDGGAVWAGIATGILNNLNDHVHLVPGNEADADDVYAVYWDRTAGDLLLRHYDDSLNSWSGISISTTGSVNERAGEYVPISIAVRHSDNHVFVAYWAEDEVDAAKDDLIIVEVISAAVSTTRARIGYSSTFVERPVNIEVDQNTDDIHLYRPDPVDPVLVQEKSTNGGISFGSTIRHAITSGFDIQLISQNVSVGTAGGKFTGICVTDESPFQWNLAFEEFAVTAEDLLKQTKSLANYVPEGDAFGAKSIPGTVTHGFLEGLAGEIVRSDALVKEFRDEILPDETVLFLGEWENAVGIPDDCFDGAGTDDERRKDVLTKLGLLGAQTLSDFLAIANRYNVTATITGGSVHGVFPFAFPIVFFPSAKVARFTIVVDLDDPLTPTFPLPFPIVFGGPNGPLVECLFKKMKPANVDVIFVNL